MMPILDTIPVLDRRTDGRTDGLTDRIGIRISRCERSAIVVGSILVKLDEICRVCKR